MRHDQFFDPFDIVMSDFFVSLEESTKLMAFVQQHCPKAMPNLKLAITTPQKLLSAVAETIELLGEIGKKERVKRVDEILHGFYALLATDANPMLYFQNGSEGVERIRNEAIKSLGKQYKTDKDFRKLTHHGYDLPMSSEFVEGLSVNKEIGMESFERLLEGLYVASTRNSVNGYGDMKYTLDIVLRCPNFNVTMIYQPEFFKRIYHMVYLKLLVAIGLVSEEKIEKVYGKSLRNHLFRRSMSIEDISLTSMNPHLEALSYIGRRYGLRSAFRPNAPENVIPVYTINYFSDPHHPQMDIDWKKPISISMVPFAYIDGYRVSADKMVIGAYKALGIDLTYQFEAVKSNPTLMYNYLKGLSPVPLNNIKNSLFKSMEEFNGVTTSLIEDYLGYLYSKFMDEKDDLRKMLVSLNQLVRDVLRRDIKAMSAAAKIQATFDIAKAFVEANPKCKINPDMKKMSIRSINGHVHKEIMACLDNPLRLNETISEVFDIHQYYHLMFYFDDLMTAVSGSEFKDYEKNALAALELVGLLYNMTHWMAVSRELISMGIEAATGGVDINLV